MKKLLSLITIAAVSLGVPINGFSAEKKMPAEKAPEAVKKTAEKPATPTKDAVAKVTGEGKTIPMHVRADAIDAKGKTFTMKKKDGVEVKHILTESTTVMNGEAPAKLEDIKVGDFVSGSRKKKSDTEYEVVKITKFGPAPEKKPKAEGVKPAEEKKTN